MGTGSVTPVSIRGGRNTVHASTVINLNIDARQVHKHFNSANNQLREFNNRARRTRTWINTISKALLSMVGVLITFNLFITLPVTILTLLGNAISYSIGNFAEFEERVLGLQSIIATTSNTLADFGDRFEYAGIQARAALLQLERRSFETIASLDETALVLQTIFASGGGRFLRNMLEAVDLSLLLSNAIATVTVGQDRQRQLAEETRSFMLGQIRANSLLAKLLFTNSGALDKFLADAVIIGDITEENVKYFKDLGVTIKRDVGFLEEMQKRLRAFFEGGQLFGRTLTGLFTQLQDRFNRLVRIAAEPTFLVMRDLIESLFTSMDQHAKELEDAFLHLGTVAASALYAIANIATKALFGVSLKQLTNAETLIDIINTKSEAWGRELVNIFEYLGKIVKILKEGLIALLDLLLGILNIVNKVIVVLALLAKSGARSLGIYFEAFWEAWKGDLTAGEFFDLVTERMFESPEARQAQEAFNAAFNDLFSMETLVDVLGVLGTLRQAIENIAGAMAENTTGTEVFNAQLAKNKKAADEAKKSIDNQSEAMQLQLQVTDKLKDRMNLMVGVLQDTNLEFERMNRETNALISRFQTLGSNTDLTTDPADADALARTVTLFDNVTQVARAISANEELLRSRIKLRDETARLLNEALLDPGLGKEADETKRLQERFDELDSQVNTTIGNLERLYDLLDKFGSLTIGDVVERLSKELNRGLLIGLAKGTGGIKGLKDGWDKFITYLRDNAIPVAMAMGKAFADMFKTAFNGGETVGQQLREALAQLIELLATAVIQAGTAIATLGWLLNDRRQIVRGLAAVAAGIAMLAVAAKIRGSGGNRTSNTAPGQSSGAAGEPTFSYNQAFVNVQQNFATATEQLQQAAEDLKASVASIGGISPGQVLVRGSKETALTGLLVKETSSGKNAVETQQLGRNLVTGGR